MKFVLASNNKKKIGELRTILSSLMPGCEVLSLYDIGFTGDIKENGKTFRKNSVIKASVPAKLGYISIADDSGLSVDALGGSPGIYSARWSGGSDLDNNAFLLKKLENVPDEKRTAKFVCAVACILPRQNDRFSVRGECEGLILRERRGTNGVGYDPLFYYPEFGATFAEIPAGKKETVSHRGRAMRAFAAAFAERIKYYGLK